MDNNVKSSQFFGKAYIKLMRILKQCGLYNSYYHNTTNYRVDYYIAVSQDDFDFWHESVFYENDITLIHEIINRSFIWADSDEGQDFWYDIYHNIHANSDMKQIISAINERK